MAVVLTALLVTAVTARHSSQLAREQIMTTVDAVGSLIRAQSPPLIAADDVWGAYTMMRATASLLPGSELKQSRAAVLDSHGRVIAASDPTKLNTASLLLGNGSQEALLPTASELSDPFRLTDSDGDLTVIDPLHRKTANYSVLAILKSMPRSLPQIGKRWVNRLRLVLAWL